MILDAAILIFIFIVLINFFLDFFDNKTAMNAADQMISKEIKKIEENLRR